jgi:hypothetical protein
MSQKDSPRDFCRSVTQESNRRAAGCRGDHEGPFSIASEESALIYICSSSSLPVSFVVNMLRTVGRCLQRNSCRLTPVAARRTFAAAAALSGGHQIAALTDANPNIDAVRYTHKNRTWTTQHVQYYSEALAIGLLENGLAPGDVVLSWLPDHFSEQVSYVCHERLLLNFIESFLNPRIRVHSPPHLLTRIDTTHRWSCSLPAPKRA